MPIARGHGRVFYFSPGDEEYPVYHHPDVLKVIANAVACAAPTEPERRTPSVSRRPTGWYETGETLSTADPRLAQS
ncbi:hypothetical protein [Actinopolymorpha sp. B9G3]|uniref:hypothetical protein n=1 Tax=Actinopolymorpha sp. B9G3 TaxID=3158970 RepID=UPI0032D8BF5B